MHSFETSLPFDGFPGWAELRALPLDQQATALRDPVTRQQLVESATNGTYALGPQAPARKVDFDAIRVVEQTVRPNPTLGDLARGRGVDPVDLLIDLALERDFAQFFAQVSGNADPDDVSAILRHPRTVMTFSDAGAHVTQIINASMPTHLLSYWVRELEAFTLEAAVRMLTLTPATAFGFADRGLVREGFAADLNVFDPATVAPALPEVAQDLPAGAKRLTQRATGIRATVVGGAVVLRDGEHTGALPGRLLRRPISVY